MHIFLIIIICNSKFSYLLFFGFLTKQKLHQPISLMFAMHLPERKVLYFGSFFLMIKEELVYKHFFPQKMSIRHTEVLFILINLAIINYGIFLYCKRRSMITAIKFLSKSFSINIWNYTTFLLFTELLKWKFESKICCRLLCKLSYNDELIFSANYILKLILLVITTELKNITEICKAILLSFYNIKKIYQTFAFVLK